MAVRSYDHHGCTELRSSWLYRVMIIMTVQSYDHHGCTELWLSWLGLYSYDYHDYGCTELWSSWLYSYDHHGCTELWLSWLWLCRVMIIMTVHSYDHHNCTELRLSWLCLRGCAASPDIPTCPSASSRRWVNRWKIWLDGWWMDTTTALHDCFVNCFSSSIRVKAVLESRPDVGSCQQTAINSPLQRKRSKLC